MGYQADQFSTENLGAGVDWLTQPEHLAAAPWFKSTTVFLSIVWFLEPISRSGLCARAQKSSAFRRRSWASAWGTRHFRTVARVAGSGQSVLPRRPSLARWSASDSRFCAAESLHSSDFQVPNSALLIAVSTAGQRSRADAYRCTFTDPVWGSRIVAHLLTSLIWLNQTPMSLARSTTFNSKRRANGPTTLPSVDLGG
jgi:hypothetical protein